MKTMLHIEGMSCEHCVRHVTEALKEISGVKTVLVSLEEKSAAVEHEESVSLDAMKASVEDAGYEVTL